MIPYSCPECSEAVPETGCPAHEGAREPDPRTRFCTPPAILDPLVRELGPIGFDPCADPKSPVASTRAILLPDHERELVELAGGDLGGSLADYGIELGDGLEVDWPAGDFVFVNPPYSRLSSKAWADRIAAHGPFARDLVAIANVSTGSKWWQPYWGASLICFLLGRVEYLGGEQKGSFDSCLLYWGQNPDAFARACEGLGRVIAP